MAAIGLFYGSSTSHTEYIAYDLRDMLNAQPGSEMVDIHNVGSVDLERMMDYDCLILGIPTWDIGQLQSDWDIAWGDLEALDLSGKKVAIFGVGDQYGYADTYQDAAGMLAEVVLECGGELVGYTSTEGHVFINSLFTEGSQFMGLALDEDSQPEHTGERLKAWVPQIIAEFGIAERVH